MSHHSHPCLPPWRRPLHYNSPWAPATKLPGSEGAESALRSALGTRMRSGGPLRPQGRDEGRGSGREATQGAGGGRAGCCPHLVAGGVEVVDAPVLKEERRRLLAEQQTLETCRVCRAREGEGHHRNNKERGLEYSYDARELGPQDPRRSRKVAGPCMPSLPPSRRACQGKGSAKPPALPLALNIRASTAGLAGVAGGAGADGGNSRLRPIS